jgi:hypothetical protein
MATLSLNRVQSQEAINVSQDYSSEPRQSVIPVSSPIASEPANASRQINDETEERVEDSYQHESVASPEKGQTLQEKDTEQAEEEDLYNVTPERTGQFRASQRLAASPQQKDPLSAHEFGDAGGVAGDRAKFQASSATANLADRNPSDSAHHSHASRSSQQIAAEVIPTRQRTVSDQDQPADLTETPSDSARADPSTGNNPHLSATSQTSATGMMSERPMPSTGKLKSGALENLRRRQEEKLGVTPSGPPKASASKSNASLEHLSTQRTQPASRNLGRGKGKSAAQRTQSPPPSGQNNASTIANASKIRAAAADQTEDVTSRRKAKEPSHEPDVDAGTIKGPSGKRRSNDTALDSRDPKRAKAAPKQNDASDFFDIPQSSDSDVPSKQTKKQQKSKASTKTIAKSKSQPSKAARKSGTTQKSFSQPADLDAITEASEARQTRSKARIKPDAAPPSAADAKFVEDGLEVDGMNGHETRANADHRHSDTIEHPKRVTDQSLTHRGFNKSTNEGSNMASVDDGAGHDAMENHAKDVPMGDGEDILSGAKVEIGRDQASRGPATQIMPGASQDAPIELSDNDGSSSCSDVEADIEETPGKRETVRTVPVVSTTRPAFPKTPAEAPPSSPPERAGFLSGKSAQPVSVDVRARKTQVIAFGQSGPLNQGSAPRKTLNEENLRHAQTTMPPLKRPLTGGSSTQNTTSRMKGPSSVATTARTTRSQAPAPPSNVSMSIGNALAVLSGKSPHSATPMPAAKMRSAHDSRGIRPSQSTAINEPQPKVPPNKNVEYDSMNNFDDFVYGDSPQAETSKRATASQLAMPPPQAKKPISTGTFFAEYDSQSQDPAVESLTAKRLASQSLEVPPSKRAKHYAYNEELAAAHYVSQGSAEASVQASRRSDLATSQHDPLANSSKPHQSDLNHNAPAKKGFPLSQHIPPDKLAVSSKSEMLDKAVSTAQDKSQPTSSRSAQPMNPRLPTKIDAPVQSASQPNPPGRAAAGEPQPAEKTEDERLADNALQPRQSRRAPRKPARQSSRASQSVDVGGSPIPPGMEVDHRTTALDKFSQEADKSRMEVPLKPSKDRHQTPTGASQPALTQPRFVRGAQRSEVLSSNKKAVPARPDAESTAIQQIKVTEAQSAFLLQSSSPTTSQDPFNRPQKSRKRHQQDVDVNRDKTRGTSEAKVLASKTDTTSNLTKQLSNLLDHTSTFHTKVREKQPKAVSKEQVRPDAAVVEANTRPTRKHAHHTEKVVNATPQAKDETLTAKVDASIEMLRGAIIPTRASIDEEEDPDKTLVNESGDETPPAESPVKPKNNKAALPKSPVQSASSSSGSSSSSSDQIDFKPWKKSLYPHQRSLFKDLVKIAHRLTQYLADQETSTEIMMDENHRQHLKFLAQEEAEQKRRYKQQKRLLKQKKKEKRIEWQKCEKQLQETLDSWMENCEERERKMAEQEAENRRFEELIGRMG